MKLKRYENNPIVTPDENNLWESLITTNPAAHYDESSGKVIMLYRAAGNDIEHLIHLGIAESADGFNFTKLSDSPVFSPLGGTTDGGCIEDPRLVKFGDWYYLTYACRPFPNGQYWKGWDKEHFAEVYPDLPSPFSNNIISTNLAFTKDFKSWIRAGRMTSPEVEDHDVIIFPEKINGKYAILHRPDLCGEEYGCEVPGIWVASTENPLELNDSKLLAVAEKDWEGLKIGANAPPIKTDAGWLMIYHGAGLDKYYRLGAMLLDLEDPSIVITRTPEAIFEPEEWYELAGCHSYKGVVFPGGNVVIDGKLIVYYGAADKYVGAAYCELDELVDFLLNSKYD